MVIELDKRILFRSELVFIRSTILTRHVSFKGVTEKVPYLKSINVGAVWLSPIFKSPQDDFGYDISNYKDIDPLFGTMNDLYKLKDVLHANGLYPYIIIL